MDLLKNPFHILNATPRDTRHRIIEISDEHSFQLDPNVCGQARANLTHPQKRLAAEIAWLPGLGPKRAAEVITVLQKNVSDLLAMDKLSSMAKANLLASGMPLLKDKTAANIAVWILNLALVFEKVDPEELCNFINEDRIVSGFPEVTDITSIQYEIHERRRYFCQVIKSFLKTVSTDDQIDTVTIAVESATDKGEKHGPILIDDLLDYYEVDVQALLENDTSNIKALVDKVRLTAESEQSDETISDLINQLILSVKKWDKIAQPIQVSTKSRGLDHAVSQQVAAYVRGLAVDLFNEHGKLDFSQQLTNMLQDVFAEVVDVAERTAADANALKDLVIQREHRILLAPVLNLCGKALENSEKDPATADKAAQNIIDAAPEILANLSSNNAPEDLLSEGKNKIALTLLGCAVDFGNKTDKWKPCIFILKEALQYATESDAKERIQTNLETVTKNERLYGNLTQISNAPSLRTINGIGFTLYGSSDKDKESGSFLSTYYLVLLAIPLFPICRFRVIPTDGGYRFLGKAPLRKFDKWHLGAFLGLIAYGIIALIVQNNSASSSSFSPTQQSSSYTSPPSQPVNNYTSSSDEATTARNMLSQEIEKGKTRANQLEIQLRALDNRLEELSRSLTSYKDAEMIDEYNGLFPTYNSLVSKRRTLYEEYNTLINVINSKVNLYNSGNHQ